MFRKYNICLKSIGYYDQWGLPSLFALSYINLTLYISIITIFYSSTIPPIFHCLLLFFITKLLFSLSFPALTFCHLLISPFLHPQSFQNIPTLLLLRSRPLPPCIRLLLYFIDYSKLLARFYFFAPEHVHLFGLIFSSRLELPRVILKSNFVIYFYY